jgi:predicted amidohydrolase
MKPEKETIKITLAQTPLYWESVQRNIDLFTDRLGALRKGSTDLVVLPEMFNTGFTMHADEVAENMKGDTIRWMKEMAVSKECVISGSIIIRDRGRFYNRFLWIDPKGNVQHYDKRHLFAMAGENKVFTPGKKRVIVSLHGWRVLLQVCYDLRFPVWSRNRKDYDVAIYTANWPEMRRYAWKQLLVARSIENQSFTVGVNRTGKDGNKIGYKGDSTIVDPMGHHVEPHKRSDGGLITYLLDHNRIIATRTALPFLKDADDFRIK